MPGLHRDDFRLVDFYKQEADTGEFYWSWFLWKNPGISNVRNGSSRVGKSCAAQRMSPRDVRKKKYVSSEEERERRLSYYEMRIDRQCRVGPCGPNAAKSVSCHHEPNVFRPALPLR